MRANHNRSLPAAVLGCSVALTACGGGGGDAASAPPAHTARAVPQTDAEIATLLYSDSARTPPDFYADAAAPSAAYVATFHLKNTDVGTAADQHELCTDDWNDALAWSETAATNAATYSDLVATESNSRFFEFGRVPRGQDGGYLRARVYRCNYLDRSGVDLLGSATAAGRLNRRPLTAADLRELSEYLWLFTSFNNFGNAVLRSSGEAAAARLEHTLHVARLQRATLAGGCDRIDVLAWTHCADAQSGMLEKDQQVLWSFGARQNAGAVELCTF